MDWLTREDIDRVLDALSADDLIEAADVAGGQGARTAAAAFNSAADRVLGKEEHRWTTRVRASDFRYLATAIGEAVNIDSPLSESTSGLLDSLEPGVEDSLQPTSEDYQPLTT